MVVADGGGDEARTALQWALSHSVRPCDTVILLDVVRSTTGKNRKISNTPHQALLAVTDSMHRNLYISKHIIM